MDGWGNNTRLKNLGGIEFMEGSLSLFNFVGGTRYGQAELLVFLFGV